MKKRHRIHLLIPYLDGEYYGTLFTTLLQEAGKRNAMLFTIQALASWENPSSFDYEIGTHAADGWILLTNPHSAFPASRRLLKAIGKTGKPVVTVGYEEREIPCHSVIIDNRRAVREAVLHLVREHGHRRIAFVGGTEHIDLIERFEGYKEALGECGIPCDERLYFRTPNALRQGGTAAAEAMLANGIDFTAVIAATDLNAAGMIETLQAAGCRIPQDVAVIGFDDLPSSAESDPPLASIHQPIADLARAGMDLLFRKLEGESGLPAVVRVPTRFVPRTSCGCAYSIKEPSVPMLKTKLERLQTNIRQLIESHNQLVANLVAASREPVFDFSKMFRGISQWGFLAMWELDANGKKQLTVKQSFGRSGDPVPPPGLTIPIERFPPAEWLPPLGDKDFVRVQFIRSDAEDLGFIVLAGPMDKLVLVSEVDITRISSSISVTALLRDRLFNQVRAIADQLEIVSRTTNDGIWDWDIENGKVYWSARTHDMLNIIGEMVTNDEQSFFRLIHPDDVPRFEAALNHHLEKGTPFKVEFRIRSAATGKQLWLFAAGDSIRDPGGKAIRMIGSLNNITEKKRAEEQITRLAFHDSLTGLPNRQLLRERFRENKARADEAGCKIGILMIDLDRFKIINDTLGHRTGDRLLVAVGRTLERLAAPSDRSAPESAGSCTVARLGGDEFIVLVPGIRDIGRLQQITDRMIERFQQPFTVDGLELYTTASIGMALYPDDGTDLDTLTRCADIAMYQAKEHGKNRSERYSRDNHNLTFERLAMENELRRAIERGEFVLYYQPQFNLEDGSIYGTEALIRWCTAERGIVSPGEFIPMAEDGGLIIPIGRWVIREACRQQKQWLDEGLTPSVVSVNISASQLHQNDFVDMVKGILEETGLPPHFLCLEITESTAIMNWHNSVEKLEKLRELGVQLALDDFGTGYSSLSMLKRLPIRSVKIDRSFVRDLAENRNDAAIASAIISLARTLGLTVIAEGVETEAQKERLRREGCHCIQGFVFSEPLTAEACYAFLRRFSPAAPATGQST